MKTLIRILQQLILFAFSATASFAQLLIVAGAGTVCLNCNTGIKLSAGAVIQVSCGIRAVNDAGTIPMPQTIAGVNPLCISATDTWTSATVGGSWNISTPLYFYCVRS